jgi:hypothetical protein
LRPATHCVNGHGGAFSATRVAYNKLVELKAIRKRAGRGGFDRQIFLEHIDQAP